MPRVAAAGLQLSTLEAVTLVALVLASCTLLAIGSPLRWRSPIAIPGAVCLAVAFATALTAPEHQGNALRFCGRMIAAALVVGLTLNAVRTRADARRLVAVLLAVGALVGVIAVLEAAQVAEVLAALRRFRPGFHVVGGQLRATSTLLYPTVASMYLEIVFALGLWWVVEPPVTARPAVRYAPLLALTLVGAGIVATFTRAGLIAMAMSLLVVAALRYVRRPAVDGPQRALAALAVALVALAGLSRSPEAWRSRVSTDVAQDWYGARYQAPSTLAFEASRVYDVPVTVANDGTLTWQSDADPIFAMSYHWLDAASDLVVEFDGARTPFARPIPPGDRVTMPVSVRAPRLPGAYVLAWDVVQEGRTWLSTQGVRSARSQVRVEGAAAGVVPTHGRLPAASHRLSRVALWRTAIAIAAAHPLGGVGPDNFRHVYGAYAGLAGWDRRAHANNMYLEALADSGVPGLAAVAWFAAAGGWALWRRWRRSPDLADGSPGPLLAAWAAMCGHGLVDSFLAFTPTYVVFALMTGLAFSAPLALPGSSDAHRV